jgi:hypothetical protein
MVSDDLCRPQNLYDQIPGQRSHSPPFYPSIRSEALVGNDLASRDITGTRSIAWYCAV